MYILELVIDIFLVNLVIYITTNNYLNHNIFIINMASITIIAIMISNNIIILIIIFIILILIKFIIIIRFITSITVIFI